MTLIDAQGAVATLANLAKFTIAYRAFATGHPDGKHRVGSACYGYHHQAPGGPSQGYYQKDTVTYTKIGTREVTRPGAWGKGPTTAVEDVMQANHTYSDMTEEQEQTVLKGVLASTQRKFYADRDDDKFLFATPLPAGFVGFTFPTLSATQRQGTFFPQRPTACNTSIIVIALAGGVARIVTHYPTLLAELAGSTLLT